MPGAATPVLPPRHLRDRFIIDGPQHPTPIQTLRRAKRYFLYRLRKRFTELKRRREMTNRGMKYDEDPIIDEVAEGAECVADYTAHVQRTMKRYKIEVKYNGDDPTFHDTKIGPQCIWETQAGMKSSWTLADEPQGDRAAGSAYDLDLAPNETVEEAGQVRRRQSEPAPASAEAKEAQEADKKGRRHSIAAIFSFLKRLSHSHHH